MVLNSKITMLIFPGTDYENGFFPKKSIEKELGDIFKYIYICICTYICIYICKHIYLTWACTPTRPAGEG